ncbi:hypothetical protein ABZ912_38300 [Nonomuraea angiospora]|uniref:hypothetical protein n=1 Tax=Nonomuraea angiospora TaxID=46172 RepID=UPI0033D19CEC
MLVHGERHFRQVLAEYEHHYNQPRPKLSISQLAYSGEAVSAILSMSIAEQLDGA